jgi:AcrR family transcriptional regulator
MSGQERREQLIEVGREVFGKLGFEGASVEEIASRAGVSKPIIYEHFAGKEGLYAVIVDREVAYLLDLILTSLREADHPRRALEAAAEAFLTYIEERREGFSILVRDAPMGTTSGTFPSLLGDVAATAESILIREFAARGYDKKIAPLYARALVGMVALVGQWWLEAGEPKREVVEAHLVNLAWNGLGNLDPDPVRTARSKAKEKERETRR